MTADAQCDQVFEAVVSKLASRLDVMNLQIFGCAAILATPAIPAQNLFANSLVRVWVQSNPRLSWR
jgi:hypothetical protein